MKKTIALVAFVMIAAISFSQRITLANYADTLSGAQTKYYPIPYALGNLSTAAFGCYVDALTSSSDSTYVSIQGSIDGSTWIDLGSSTYANTITVGAEAPTTFKVCRFYTTDAGMIWNIEKPMNLPWYRFKVQHYKTGTTVRFKGWMYIKK